MKIVNIEIALIESAVDMMLEDGRQCRVPMSREVMNNLIAACAPVIRDALGDMGEAAFNAITKSGK